MSADARKRAFLALLLIVMAVLWYRVWQQSPDPAVADAPAPVRDQPSGAGDAAETAASVELAALRTERPLPGPVRRNLFQYGGSDRPVEPPPVFVAPAPVISRSDPVPSTPVMTLKLIGIAQPRGNAGSVAVLSDERGVYHGTEGTIIEGRYRIVRIDGQSVELTTLDGSGLYVLRLPPS